MTDLACVRNVALRCAPAAMLTACLGALVLPGSARAAQADFTWTPNPAVVDSETTFRAVEDPSIQLYRWDLDGNGQYDDAADASGPVVPRTFQRVRTYTIGLVVMDNVGNVSEMVKGVDVISDTPPGPGNHPPEASFVFFPAGPVAGEPITFVSTSTDVDSPIQSSGLTWDLNNDGAFDDGEGSAVTTSFPAPGTYTISLRITTNATDIATLVLNVGAPGAPGTSAGQRALSLLSPFPVVRIVGRVTGRGARIRRLTVTAPPGSTVKLRCTGKGCPFKRVLRRVSIREVAGRGLPATRVLRVRRLEGRLLRGGITLRLFVTRGETVGKFTRFRIRRGKPPLRADMCLVPGQGRAVPCPGH